jgi:glyceraldehyde 3-phosphate dehydrogenase
VDFTAVVSKNTTKEEVNAALKAASETSLKNIMGFCTDPLVSHDFNGDVRSSVIDAELTMVVEGNLVKIITWYDNESGFSQRMLDVTHYIASKGL